MDGDAEALGTAAAVDEAQAVQAARVVDHDAGVAVDTATPKVVPESLPEHTQAMVQWWWDETSRHPEFEAASLRYDEDVITVLGGSQEDDQNEAWLQSNLAFRYLQQSLSFLLATPPSARFKPHRKARGMAGKGPIDADPVLVGFADTMDVLVEQHLEEAGWPLTQEGFVQDGLAFEASILKVTFQREYQSDPVTEQRLPDSQDNAARLAVLAEAEQEGDITQDDAEHHDLLFLARYLGEGEQAVWQGLVVENIPLKRFRVSRNVTSPELFYNAHWKSQDVYYCVEEVLKKFRTVQRDDLRSAKGYRVDAATDLATPLERDPNKPYDPKDDDHLLVREVWDFQNQRRLVLIEGLTFPVVEEPIEDGDPYLGWVVNRRPKTWYGRSMARLLAKDQRRIDRKRSDEERGRNKARPRYAYDKGGIDEEDVNSVNSCPADQAVGVKVSAKEMQNSFFTLESSHKFDPAVYDTTKDEQAAESKAGIPRQALAQTGNAKFAVEVEAAAAGQNAAAARIKRTLAEVLARMRQRAAMLLARYCQMQVVKLIAGDQAVWPVDQADREQLMRGLMPEVTITYQGPLDRQRRLEALKGLVDLSRATGKQLPFREMARLFAREAGMDADLEAAIDPDPNDLVAQLAEILGHEPDRLGPPAMAALAGMGMEAAQRAMAAARARSANPGLRPGGMPPMLPGGPPAPMQALPAGAPG